MKRYLSLRAWAAGEGPVRVSSRPLMIQEELLSPGCTLPAYTFNVPVRLGGKLHGLSYVCVYSFVHNLGHKGCAGIRQTNSMCSALPKRHKHVEGSKHA